MSKRTTSLLRPILILLISIAYQAKGKETVMSELNSEDLAPIHYVSIETDGEETAWVRWDEEGNVIDQHGNPELVQDIIESKESDELKTFTKEFLEWDQLGPEVTYEEGVN